MIEDGRHYQGNPSNTVRLCGFDIERARRDPDMLGALGRLIGGMDRVIVHCRPEREDDWCNLLSAFNVRVDLIDERATRLGALEVGEHRGDRTLMVAGYPLSMRSRALKRSFDIVLSFVGLILVSPLLLLVAGAILMEDGRPLFFRQQRIGRDNTPFSILKFRSMSVDQRDDGALELTSRGDPRVTRVGRIIRASSIDELPQLLNVLRGDMSLVGPRPHAPLARAGTKLYWEVDARYWHRHRLRPGLSGLAQVQGYRGNTEEERHLSDRLEADLQYIEGWSIWRDVRIIIATARVLIHSRAF